MQSFLAQRQALLWDFAGSKSETAVIVLECFDSICFVKGFSKLLGINLNSIQIQFYLSILSSFAHSEFGGMVWISKYLTISG